ncbi:MAG: hypothetical protein H6739_00990 [Alphaproteobacteria bacterium]|nr:hypothetical protein [Alphaproteobacteria bacterium]
MSVALLALLSLTAAAAPLSIAARVDDGAWKSGARSPVYGQAVEARVAEIPDATIRWYQIFPNLAPLYKNANHPWEPEPYKWVGLDTIEYKRVEVEAFAGQWQVTLFEAGGQSHLLADPWGSPYHHRSLGSFWLQAEVEVNGETRRSPGIEDVDAYGLTPDVFRVSVRQDDSYLGYLTSFFNVPGLFGSVTRQSEHYIGVDCADALVAAEHRWRGQKLEKNYNVAMLMDRWPAVAKTTLSGGDAEDPLRWGEQIKPGDVIAVRYPGARGFQHIGALYRDADGDGLLSEGDLVIHAGPHPLTVSRLRDGGFDGEVRILRP